MGDRDELKIEWTERGFPIAEFKDKYRSECSIQDSSLAVCEGDPEGSWCIWLGVDTDFQGRECSRMHLTQNQVAIFFLCLGGLLRLGASLRRTER